MSAAVSFALIGSIYIAPLIAQASSASTPEERDQVSVSLTSLRLNFRDITWDETNLSAERRVGATGTWVVFNFGALNAGNQVGGWYWNNTGLASKTQYCYRLRTTNAVGSSAYSPIVCGTTL